MSVLSYTLRLFQCFLFALGMTLGLGAKATIFTPGLETLRVYACSGTNPNPPWNHTCRVSVQTYPALSQHVPLALSVDVQSSLTGVNAFSTSATTRGRYDPNSRVVAAYLSAVGVSPGGPGQIGSAFASPHSDMQLKFADAIFLDSNQINSSDSLRVRFRVPLVRSLIQGLTGGYQYRFDYTVDFNNQNAYTYHAAGNNTTSTLSITQGSFFEIVTPPEFNLSILLDASATAFASNFSPGQTPNTIDSKIILDFGNTIYWGGIESVYNVTQKQPVNQWTLHSLFAGVKWDLASPVPEPPSAFLFGWGIAIFCALHLARKRFAGCARSLSKIQAQATSASPG